MSDWPCGVAWTEPFQIAPQLRLTGMRSTHDATGFVVISDLMGITAAAEGFAELQALLIHVPGYKDHSGSCRPQVCRVMANWLLQCQGRLWAPLL